MTPSERAVYLSHRQEWTATIGDPTPLGWITVAAYATAALLAARAAMRARRAEHGTEAAVWALFAAGLGFLAVNKQIDLQSLITITGRDLAFSQGWYHHRRKFQLALVVATLVGGVAGLGYLLLKTRELSGWLRLALAGMGFIATFVVIRAASFNHVDHFIASGPLGVRWNWMLELGGIAVVAFAALRYRPTAANTG